MATASGGATFTGSISALYEAHLVPLLFEPYAADLAQRAAALAPQRVLELAAGTGVVTRALAALLPASVPITATDVSEPMLEVAKARGTSRPVMWQPADAMALPYADGAFDLVVCQFGVMFFPDKVQAFAQARRVLAPGGTLLFNVWDRLEANQLAATVSEVLAQLFPADPPRFMARTPHGYFDPVDIARDLSGAGFSATPQFETVARRSRASSARGPAVAYCQGTPMRNEIEARDRSKLGEATARAEAALTARFGAGPVDAAMRAHVVSITA